MPRQLDIRSFFNKLPSIKRHKNESQAHKSETQTKPKSFKYEDIQSFTQPQNIPTLFKPREFYSSPGGKNRLRKTNPSHPPRLIKTQNNAGETVYYFNDPFRVKNKIKITLHSDDCYADVYKCDNHAHPIRCGEATLNDAGWLLNIDVDGGFQRLGVATAMIQILIKTFPNFKVPYHGNETDNDDLFLTTQGKALANKLIKQDILKESHWDQPVPFAALPEFGM